MRRGEKKRPIQKKVGKKRDTVRVGRSLSVGGDVLTSTLRIYTGHILESKESIVKKKKKASVKQTRANIALKMKRSCCN